MVVSGSFPSHWTTTPLTLLGSRGGKLLGDIKSEPESEFEIAHVDHSSVSTFHSQAELELSKISFDRHF